MLRLIGTLFATKKAKFAILGGIAATSLVIGAVVYVNHLKSTVDDLRTSNTTLQIQNSTLSETMRRNREQYERDIDQLNRLYSKYMEILRFNELRNEELGILLNEIEDEQIRQCLDVNLPSNIIDRMFDQTRR